ncbi:MAG TPA: hypothetical protein DE312_03360 [Gallionella sp.]|nr:MAG: hypothetical protein A2Z87_05020 [Gallionellales bacterium GWA2_54_124]OGT41631.1 MAG: hypothetical protein A3K00_08030 [Gallionellales bacterium RIFOXYD2_FULL_52_7]HCI52360.1 hypothetical protein [Gallionella sp.]
MLNFNGTIVELNSGTHLNLRIDEVKPDYRFARNCTSLPVTFDELTSAAQEYPIFFMYDEHEQVCPVVLFGLPVTGNLLVSAAGLWRAAYIPQALQRYPFLPDLTQPAKIYLDETSRALNFETGELLVNAEGVLQPRANDELQFFQHYAERLAQTRLIAEQLKQQDLLSPLKCEDADIDFPAAYSIDEAKLQKLSDAVLPALFHSGALQLAYLQLASQDHLPGLIHTANRQLALNTDKVTNKPEPLPRRAEQIIQRPALKARIVDAPPLMISADDQQEILRKQEVAKKLSDETNRLAQVHKQRYTQSLTNAPLAPEIPEPLDTLINTKNPLQWRWALGVLAGAVIFTVYFFTGSKTAPSTPVPNTPAASSPALTDPFSTAMIRIAPGKFEMGSTDGDKDEKPIQQINISPAFELGKTEVTQRQWVSVMGRLPEKLAFKQCGDNCPVENISWNDAQEFINKLNTTTGKSYRLPSEAEWEYACRAGKNQRYCGGNNPDELAWYNNAGKAPHPVASKQANAWGLYDMSGNVWEWVDDCYHPRATQGDRKETCDTRVLRGGSWSNDEETPRAANRYKRTAGERVNNNGLRLARTLP